MYGVRQFVDLLLVPTTQLPLPLPLYNNKHVVAAGVPVGGIPVTTEFGKPVIALLPQSPNDLTLREQRLLRTYCVIHPCMRSCIRASVHVCMYVCMRADLL